MELTDNLQERQNRDVKMSSETVLGEDEVNISHQRRDRVCGNDDSFAEGKFSLSVQVM